MNSHNISIITCMRMCIILRWFSMCCPSCMTDTAGSFYGFTIIRLLSKNFQSAFCFNDLCICTAVTYSNSCRVVTTIFQF